MNFKIIDGSITAPIGFTASGVHCGIRRNRSKKDLSLIACDTLCNSAAIYTTNKVKGAPLIVTKEHLQNGKAQAVICNSGNANTCNADGVFIANSMCEAVAEAMNLNSSDVIVASTGVIGQPLPIEPIKNAIPSLCKALSKEGATDAVEGIMTTDTRKKEYAISFEIGGKVCHLGGIAKGSGMINPNMATTLTFITTDVAIESGCIAKILKEVADATFNMITIDGDTSTNDMVSILASGKAENKEIVSENDDYNTFKQALTVVMTYLSREIARDGEGATKLVECEVLNAQSLITARTVAKSVVGSNLFKAAMFGSDANWGRVLCAVGYSDCDVDVEKIDVSFSSVGGKIDVCKNGKGIDFSEEQARSVLVRDEVKVIVDLKDGKETATAFGCDLTYDYVKINGDYRT